MSVLLDHPLCESDIKDSTTIDDDDYNDATIQSIWERATIAGIAKRLGSLGTNPARSKTKTLATTLEKALEQLIQSGNGQGLNYLSLLQMSRQVKWLQNYERYGDTVSLMCLEHSLDS